jgi:hypothetical protein
MNLLLKHVWWLHCPVQEFSTEMKGIAPRDVLELMLITQYFDTIKDVGTNGRNSTIFMPHAPGALNDITSQIRYDMGCTTLQYGCMPVHEQPGC